MACIESADGGFRADKNEGEGPITPVGDPAPGPRNRHWPPRRRTRPRTASASGGERSGRTMPILTAAPAH